MGTVVGPRCRGDPVGTRFTVPSGSLSKNDRVTRGDTRPRHDPGPSRTSHQDPQERRGVPGARRRSRDCDLKRSKGLPLSLSEEEGVKV